MSERSSRSGPAAADNLAVHLTEFIATIARAGYAEKTQHDKERLIQHFIRWVREAGIAIAALDEGCVETFLAYPSRRRYMHRTALHQFVRHLRRAEVVPPRCSEPSPAEILICRYVDYLRNKQGLSPHSVAVYSPFPRICRRAAAPGERPEPRLIGGPPLLARPYPKSLGLVREAAGGGAALVPAFLLRRWHDGG